ncbi:fatty acyl-AMP ligase [Phormidium tenue FACHB-886]|nr:fatty acyl-AMP ligase [Phormidium tenue FACHB-886]
MNACFTDSIGPNPKVATLIELLGDRATKQSAKVAFTFLQDGETETGYLTYQALEQQAKAIAANLQSMVEPGSRALLLYPPGLEFIAAFFGCLYAGVVAVPAYPPRRNQNIARVQAIATSAQAAIALTTSNLLGDLENRLQEEAGLSSLQWLATDQVAIDAAAAWQAPAISSSTLAFLQFTSGSTGTPKGVMVSHGNLLHNSELIHQCFEDTPDSSGLSWLPPYHDMGLIGGILQPLYVGASMILMPPVAFIQKPLRWLQAISHYKVTTSGGPNFAYDLCSRKITPEQLASFDLSSWQLAFTGAEPVRAETLEQFASIFAACGFQQTAFQPCYGMAETTLLVSGGLKSAPPVIRTVDGAALERNQVVNSTEQGENSRVLVGCGYSRADQQVRIVDPETLTACPDGQVGEIWVSGPSIAQGYWNQPKETEQTFQAYLGDTEGPFLRTGDLGFLQENELFITGRIKDVIIIRGQNHYPQDIEFTVEKSHPALRPNCGAAFAVEIKGKERLIVVQEVERSYLRKLNVKEVVGNICQAVTVEHGLQVYTTVLVKTGSIPKTSSGKIQRHACRAAFLTGNLNVVEDWSEHPQGKAKFLHLEADVNSLLQELLANK